MNTIKHSTKYFTYGCFMASLLFLPATASADQKKNSDDNLMLSWETPEEGTAVNYNNDRDYAEAPPVLRSSRSKPLLVKTQINMAPVLQRLILPGTEDQVNENEDDEGNSPELDIGRKAAQKAMEFYENKVKTVNVNGSVLNIETDCSFFVRAAYWEGSGHTKDLFRESIAAKAVELKKATGVTLLSSYFEKNYRYQTKKPRVGDIIIFDNTYDKNRNEKRDDPYTHTGIVTNIRADQTIEFIHGNIGKTIKKGYINFQYQNNAMIDNQPVNSYIRAHYTWEKDKNLSLASHLVRAFAGY